MLIDNEQNKVNFTLSAVEATKNLTNEFEKL